MLDISLYQFICASVVVRDAVEMLDLDPSSYKSVRLVLTDPRDDSPLQVSFLFS